MKVGIALIGFGNVGQALLELLLDKRAILESDHDLQWQINAITTARHGCALSPDGLDPIAALEIAQTGGDLSELGSRPCPGGFSELLRASGADVMFENTPVNYRTGQPAIDHLRAALQAGMDAITANKGPVVHAHSQLSELAQTVGRSFLFESTVMDGAPLFGMWREALPLANLTEFRGILNSTTNYVLQLLEEGHDFESAIAQAQEIGIAETDPSGDIEGWDAAVKTCALVTVLMGETLPLDQIDRTGIADLTPEGVRAARQGGERWKLICSAKRDRSQVTASVRPQLVRPEDPLFYVDGTSSAVTFYTDVLGALTITESDPGPHTTAYGLLADFINAMGLRP